MYLKITTIIGYRVHIQSMDLDMKEFFKKLMQTWILRGWPVLGTPFDFHCEQFSKLSDFEIGILRLDFDWNR